MKKEKKNQQTNWFDLKLSSKIMVRRACKMWHLHGGVTKSGAQRLERVKEGGNKLPPLSPLLGQHSERV